MPVGIFPGYDLRRPVTEPIDTTPRPVTTRDNQQKLVDLGFMAAGGVAFHEFGSVPAYAASHGCIRVNHYDAALLFGFAEQGTPVEVFDEAAL